MNTHNHNTKKSLYSPECPACQANREFIKTITQPGITQKQYDKALEDYRKITKTAERR